MFCAFHDASKAFDKVLINGLLYKLIARNVPLQFIRLLFNWFNNTNCSVVWLSVRSISFSLTCGVRQGGVLSPFLFPVYVDDLILQLRSSGYGIYVGSMFSGCIFMQPISFFYPAVALVYNECLAYAVIMALGGTLILMGTKVMLAHFAVFALRHLVVSSVGCRQRKLNTGAELQTFRYPTNSLKIVSVFQRIHGEIWRTDSDVKEA